MTIRMSNKRRMNRLFSRKQRTLIVALDHGHGLNVLPGLADPARVIDGIREGGADAVLTTFGVASNFASNIGNMGLVLRIDGGGSALDGGFRFKQHYRVEEALKLGADAVACMGFPGVDGSETLDTVAHLAGECWSWQLPLLAEMLPAAWDKSMHTPENVRLASRIGVELGADIIKTTYTGDKESFRELTDAIFAPIVVLGGSKAESDAAWLQGIRDALDAGASGVAVGRNVWQHSNVRGITRALARLVHDDASVDEVLPELKG